MNFTDEDRENRLEELKINIFTHQRKIEDGERNHTTSKDTLEAWKRELRNFVSERESLKNPSEKE